MSAGQTAITAAFGLTDVGRCRETNQDELLVDTGLGLFAVADGMGGHAAGEVASHLAIESLAETMASQSAINTVNAGEAEHQLEHAFHEGNRKICESVLDRGEWRGMGTTIVAILSIGDEAVVGHVGDSRAYRLRDGALEQLTSDHSWVNEQVKLGLMTDSEAQRHPMRNIVTRALGNRSDLQVDLTRLRVLEGDLFLLCSDGLNSMLSDLEIQTILHQNRDNLEAASRELIDRANSKGGEDNVTVVLISASGVSRSTG